MLKHTIFSLIVLGFICSPVKSFALDPSKDCTKEILYSFFPEIFVNEALEKNNIPEEKWAKIRKDLKEKDKGIIKSFEEKISELPENERSDREIKMEIFRDTLIDTFAEVLENNGIDDEDLIDRIYDDISTSRAKRFQECVKHHEQMPAPSPKY